MGVPSQKLARLAEAMKRMREVGQYQGVPSPVSTGNIDPNPDALAARSILEQNRGKNFVDRLFDPARWPKLDNKDGTYSTHRMAWTAIGGDGEKKRYIVFPTIIFTPNGGLEKLDTREAVLHAMKTGEFIAFDKPQDADWFSQRYKAGTTPNAPPWKPEPQAWEDKK